MNHILEQNRKAAERVAALLALPMPEDEHEIGQEGYFDPWQVFPALYGTYCGSFDRCAIEVLEELLRGRNQRDDLGAEMLREMLCNADLCEYGSSPRACFPTEEFRAHLPLLIERWRVYSRLHWGKDFVA